MTLTQLVLYHGISAADSVICILWYYHCELCNLYPQRYYHIQIYILYGIITANYVTFIFHFIIVLLRFKLLHFRKFYISILKKIFIKFFLFFII